MKAWRIASSTGPAGLAQIRPVIDRVFEFDDAPAAFEYFTAGRHVGKVVIHHG